MTEEEKKAFLAALLTHGNTHIEQVNLGDGYMNCTFGNTSNARQDNSNIEEAVVLPSTPEEAMKAALVWLMEERDEKGAYLFDEPNQWGVIYRVALDKRLCKNNVSAFGRWIDSLGIEGQRMKSPDKNLSRYAIPVSFDTWLSKKGDDYDETKAEIGRRFRSKLENLLP